MKGLSAITLAVALTVSTSAFAATTKAKASASKAGANSATATTALPNTSPSANSANLTGTGAIAAPAPKATDKNWSMDLYAENYYTVQNAEQGNGSMDALAFVGFNYKLAPARNLSSRKVYIRQNFTAAISNETQTESVYRMDDTELGLGLGKLAAWNNGGISLTNKLYLPTGKMARLQDRIAVVRADVTTAQEIGKNLEVGHLLSPRVSVQSRDTYIGEDGAVAQTRLAKLVQYAYATAKANDKLSGTVALGTIDTISKRRGDKGSNSYLDISATAQLTKAIALSLGVDSEPNMGKGQTKRHAFLRGDETQYYMNVFANM